MAKNKEQIEFTARPDAIRQQIRKSIQEGRYAPGERLAPTDELARQYHVSKNTVSLAMRLLVQEGLVERRRGDGTYVSGQASPGASRASRAIGICLPMLASDDARLNALESPTWFTIFGGVASRLEERGYSLVVIPRTGEELSEQVKRHNLAGLLLPNRDDYIEEVLTSGLNRQLHCLFMGVPGAFTSLNYVEELAESKMSEICLHLQKRGFKRLAVVSSSDTDYMHTAVWRGFRAAVKGKGYSIHYEVPMPEGAAQSEYDLAVARLLALPAPPEAIVVVRSRFVDGVKTALAKAGVTIPIVVVENSRESVEDLPRIELCSKSDGGRVAADKIADLVEEKCECVQCAMPWTWRENEA